MIKKLLLLLPLLVLPLAHGTAGASVTRAPKELSPESRECI
jgi:hypothetical protein